jgi:hypothetical protein
MHLSTQKLHESPKKKLPKSITVSKATPKKSSQTPSFPILMKLTQTFLVFPELLF